MGLSASEGDEGVPEHACNDLVQQASLDGETAGFTALTAGFSNYVWKTTWEKRDLVVKCFTDLVLLRIEMHAVGAIDQLASRCHVGPRVHSCCHLGMVMDFLPGDTLEEAHVHCGDWHLLEQIAMKLFALHRQEVPMAAMGEPMLWRTMDKMLLVVDGDSLPSSLPSLPALRQEISAARRALEAMEPKVVCGHGDFKPSNVIQHEGEVWLIDFELGGPNYRGFDWMKLFRRPEGVSQKDLEHFLQSYASHEEEKVDDLSSMLRETLAFEPLTWLEAFVFFLALPKYKPEDVAKWQRLAEHRWEMYQQTRYRLLP